MTQDKEAKMGPMGDYTNMFGETASLLTAADVHLNNVAALLGEDPFVHRINLYMGIALDKLRWKGSFSSESWIENAVNCYKSAGQNPEARQALVNGYQRLAGLIFNSPFTLMSKCQGDNVRGRGIRYYNQLKELLKERITGSSQETEEKQVLEHLAKSFVTTTMYLAAGFCCDRYPDPCYIGANHRREYVVEAEEMAATIDLRNSKPVLQSLLQGYKKVLDSLDSAPLMTSSTMSLRQKYGQRVEELKKNKRK